MNTNNSDSRRPVIGRISVIVNKLTPTLTGWDIQDAQREGHKALVGLELDTPVTDTFMVSEVRAGIKAGDQQEVMFSPSGKEESLKAGMGYILLISSFPGAPLGDFIVLGFTPADIFMAELKKFQDHKKNQPKHVVKKQPQIRRESPLVQNLDHNTIYRLKGKDFQSAGTVQIICDEAMKTFGSEWRQEIKLCHWFKKEGMKYSPTPSKRPELPVDNKFAIDYGDKTHLAMA